MTSGKLFHTALRSARQGTSLRICLNIRSGIAIRPLSSKPVEKPYSAKTIHGLPLQKMVGDHSWAQDDLERVGEPMRKGSWIERVKMFGGQREITDEVFHECPDGVRNLVDEILALNRVEITWVINRLQKRMGISDEKLATARIMPYDVPMGASHVGGAAKGGVTGGAAAAAPVEEKTIFDLKLMSFDATSKIKVIKEVRTATGIGLKEAKDLVDAAPGVIKKGLTKTEAEELKKVFAAVGGVVELV